MIKQCNDIGFYRSGNSKWYLSNSMYIDDLLKLKDEGKRTFRFIMKWNKQYKKGSNRPKFTGFIVNGIETADNIDFDEILDDDDERLYTREEVQYAINRATEDAQRGYTDNIVEDYL